MAADPISGDLVLIGGSDGRAWRWDGAAWTIMQPEQGPTSRLGATISVDLGRSELVYVGGRADAAYRADSWYWNGLVWTEENAVGAVTRRAHHGLAFDPIQRQLIMFGGETAEGVIGSTWVRF